MSVQVNFYALEDDIWSLFQRPVPLAFRAVEALDPPPSGHPLADLWPTFIAYLLPPGAASDEVTWRPLKSGGGRVVAEHSPVVELSVASQSEGTLAASRVWLGATQVTPYRREAMAYYKELQRQIAKWPQAQPSGYRVGPAAAAAVRDGALRLVVGIQGQTLG